MMLRQPVSFRRTGTAVALLLAGLLFVIGIAATPWEPEPTTASFIETITARSTQGQIAALLLHYSSVALAAGVLGLFAALRRRGTILGHLAGVLAFVGAVNLSGMLLIDWFAIGLGRSGMPTEEAVTIYDAAITPMAGIGWAALGFAGLALGLPVFLLALWRTGFVPWWPAAAVFGAIVAGEAVPAGPVTSTAAAVPYAFALGYVALRVFRTDDVTWATGGLPVDVDDAVAAR
jgi:hypothetical protein